MKRVTFVVEMCALVPDDCEPDDLCLNLNTDLIEVETIQGDAVKGSVTSYGTVRVTVDSEQGL